ncbi:MAG: protein arginine kinase [Firmicutes bacterium]|nr:protein arginine kinase [Bacillota bacterium]
MPWNRLVSQPQTRWTAATGPDSDVVLSSRVRLARNLEDFPFPHRMNERQARELIRQVEAGIREINLMGICPPVELYRLADTPYLDRQVLVEKHLISRELAQDARGRAVAISEDEAVSIMINEEDHLRIQVLAPGLDLYSAWELGSKVDDALEAKLPYAFHKTRGYLTACPTNVGTGLRASVMVHLPALVMTNQAGRLFNTLGQFGLAIRGYFGEGTEPIGNIYQISNQITLGRSEEEILDHLQSVVQQVIGHERRAREHLARQMKAQLEDRVGRAYGILTGARILSSEEAMRLLSDVRLGVEMGILKGVAARTLNELMIACRPAFLQKLAGRELSPFERDLRRAALIRERLAA